ncbi:MAG: DUF6531 domain-containing protein, partial [Thermodesulfobacteriota bacterium]
MAEFIPVKRCLNTLTNTLSPCADNCVDPVNKGGTTEICGDGIDNNCNGLTDEGEECGSAEPELTKNLGSGGDKAMPATECSFSIANFSTGNLYEDQTVPLGFSDLTLSYNSLDSYTGPLGKGWGHTFNVRLSQITGVYLILIEED